MLTINEVINKFNNVKGGGNQYTARCPAHDDNANSLAIGCGEDGILKRLRIETKRQPDLTN